MDTNHTKEPWEALRVEYGYALIIMRGGEKYPNGTDATDDDFRRIVACVNACAGISDEQLEDDCFTKMREDRNLLLSQRDKLLDALNRATDKLVDAEIVATEFINIIAEIAAGGEFGN